MPLSTRRETERMGWLTAAILNLTVTFACSARETKVTTRRWRDLTTFPPAVWSEITGASCSGAHAKCSGPQTCSDAPLSTRSQATAPMKVDMGGAPV